MTVVFSVADILADSESDLDDIEDKKPAHVKRKQPQTWIEENADNIVDFKDPTAVSKITGNYRSCSFVYI